MQQCKLSLRVRLFMVANRKERMQDWKWQVIGEGTIGEDGKLTVPAQPSSLF